MLDSQFIIDEITALDFEYPQPNDVEEIRQRAENYIAYDSFLVQEILEKVDQAIFDQHLPEIQ